MKNKNQGRILFRSFLQNFLIFEFTSFSNKMDITKLLLLIIQMGSAPVFPDGDASMQKMLAEKIIVECRTVDGELGNIYIDTLHIIKNHPKFKKTQRSFFDENNYNAFIFLTQIDSTHLFTEDCDYSMLKFLRLKTRKNNLSYTVLDSTDNIVSTEALRQISWSGGITMKMFEDNNVFTTTFPNYTEYWQCSKKMDYAPKYPYINPVKTSLRKNLPKSEVKSAYDVLTKPIFVFSVIPFDDNSWGENISARSVKAALTSSKGEEIEGRSIDLNNDNIADAFWYVDVVDSNVAQWYARLYINYLGEWILVWYTYFKEK